MVSKTVISKNLDMENDCNILMNLNYLTNMSSSTLRGMHKNHNNYKHNKYAHVSTT